MMRKLFRILIIMAIAAVGTASLSGCFLLPQYNDSNSMEIGGETYVTGFYDNLLASGISYHEPETAEFESKYHNWWKVEGAPFDMYCAQNKEALNWHPAIYCKQRQFDEVKAYYTNPDNYNYYIGMYLEYDTTVLLGEYDEEYAERAIEFIIELDNAFGAGGIFDPLEDRKITVSGEALDSDKVTIYRVSKDGFFTTIRLALTVYDGMLYCHHSYDEQKDQTTFYFFDEDVSRHMVNLFEQCGLIERQA